MVYTPVSGKNISNQKCYTSSTFKQWHKQWKYPKHISIFLHTKNALKVNMYITHTSIHTHPHDMQD